MKETNAVIQKKIINKLVAEFEKRREHNPQYSLRSFSRTIGINDSTLSQIMRGKRKITDKTFNHIAAALNLDIEQITKINELKIKYLDTKKAKALSHWKYDAILEYIEAHPTADINTLSQAFNLHTLEVQSAISLLQELGFLSYDTVPKNLLGASSTISDPKVKCLAGQQYQKSLLEKSKQSIDKISKENRDHTSIIIGISDEDLKEVRQIIAEARKKIMKTINNSESKKSNVYAMQFSVFPLNNKGDKNE
ncbi:MAG: TIGR02147 family protein [Bdellovibrionales bacterium]|nr:TIGR02147 family protein [Bdellovibrionales bacterium]